MVVTSLVLPAQRCHNIWHAWWSGATLRYACFYNPTISDMRAGFMNSSTHVCKYCFIKHGIRSDSNIYAGEMPVTNPSELPKSRMLLPQGCKTCGVPSWMPSWIYRILNDVLIASLECYKDVYSSKISKIKICMQIPGAYQSQGRYSYIFCYKLPSWRPSCPHSFPSFYLVTD